MAPHRRLAGCGFIALAAALGMVAFDAPVRARPTFSIDYVVTIRPNRPQIAEVRWELSGVEEIKTVRLRFPATRFTKFQGTGKLNGVDGGLVWKLDGPYAHLTYEVAIDHLRGQHQRYDSYATKNWIVTRARDLFPRTTIGYSTDSGQTPKSRARLIFRLPPGWHTATAATPLGSHSYLLDDPGKVLDRPRGWLALGRFTPDRQEIGGIMVQLARVQGPGLAPKEVFDFLGATLPVLQKLLAAEVSTVLLVSAPDPMWHGGISGEHSLFIHSGRPLRTPDKTSPYLHELFHVLQPYKPAADADWIEEGMAEFYSLELQRRAGLIDAAAFARALGYLERFGLWNVDLTQQQDNAATNNSAPLVLYALDQHIQHATAGKRRLDDVVTLLAKQGGVVDTADLLQAVNGVTGKNFSKFFERHVHRGVPPNLSRLP